MSLIFEFVVTKILEHGNDMLKIEVFGYLLLDLDELLVELVHEYEVLLGLVLLSDLGDDACACEVLEYV